ncbi:MAG TPA: hypothetical protein VFR37_11575 [Longimicrobium sp.]|nr:hypothetical protein [Longimicrobium sp.]
MQKLKLGLENLQVESFDTGAGDDSRGTVHGHATQFCTRFNGVTCNGGYTCDGGYTCGGDTCEYNSCDYACDTYYCATNPSCGVQSCLGTCPPQATCELGCQ